MSLKLPPLPDLAFGTIVVLVTGPDVVVVVVDDDDDDDDDDDSNHEYENEDEKCEARPANVAASNCIVGLLEGSTCKQRLGVCDA